MKVDQATIDAVNNALADAGLVSMRPNGETGLPALYADDVSAILLALAKCEPVVGLVRVLESVQTQYGVYGSISDKLAGDVSAALAAFGGGQ